MSVTTRLTVVISMRTSTRQQEGEVTASTAGTTQTDLTVRGARTTTTSSPTTGGVLPVNVIPQVKLIPKSSSTG